jgi:hypothetical protein
LSLSHGLILRPPSRLGNPVPPPTQPMLSSRRCTGLILSSALQRHFDSLSGAGT